MNTESPETMAKVAERPTRNSVGRGVLCSTGGTAGVQLVGIVAFILIARALDPEAFGLLALARLFVALLEVFINQGLVQAVVQRPTLEKAHLDVAFWTNLCLSMLLSAVLVLAAAPLSVAFNEALFAPVLRVLSLSLVLGALGAIHRAILQREMRFGGMMVPALLGSIGGGALGLGLAWNGYGVWALAAQVLVGQCMTVLGLWVVTSWRPRMRYSIDRLRELSGFGLHVLGGQLLNVVNHRTVDFIIGSVLGKGALGLYNIAWQVHTSVNRLLIVTVTRVFLATLSRFQEEPDVFRRTYYAGVRLTSAAVVPACVGIAILAPEIANTVFGPQWADAAPLIRILALLGIVTVVDSLSVTAIASLGYPQYNLRLNGLNALVTLVAVMAAASSGLIVVAVAFVVRAYLLWPLRYAVLRRLCGVSFRELAVALSGVMASAGVMAAGLVWLRYQDLGLGPYSRLALLIILGGLIYILAMALTAPATLRQGVTLARSGLVVSDRE